MQSNMKALVTGGCGFIGSHLTESLLSRGHEVIVLDNLEFGRLDNLKTYQKHPRLRMVVADVRELSQIQPSFEGVDWVFHLAGIADIVPSIERPELYFETNVTGTLNVLQCAREAAVKRFIYAASSSCYGIPKIYPTPESAPVSPMYPYALTKYMGEMLVLHWSQIYTLESISLRLFNVFGPRSRTNGAYGAVFGVFMAQKLNNQPFTVVGDGTQTRDFTYVTDVVEAFLLAAESRCSNLAFNVGSGHHHSINYLTKLLGGTCVNIPKRPGEPDCTYADTSKIFEVLGWKPKVSFESAVGMMVEHIDFWRDAPVWDQESIARATAPWFKHLSS